MDTGVCFQNSCDRHLELVKNPTLATEKLPVGSSPLGRFVRGTLTAQTKLRAKEPNPLTPYEIDPKMLPLNGIQEIPRLFKTRCDPFLLFFKGQKGGHTINVQCDPKNQIFRFCDDNLGYFDYQSQADLEKGLAGCLKAFYPQMSSTYFAVYSEEY
jgi:hypothetical protein